MNFLARLAALVLAAGGCLVGTAASAPAKPPWMTEEAIRSGFIGKTLDGHYITGERWTETYFANGRLDYREVTRHATGDWSFRGSVFCTFYDPKFRPALNGGCWTVLTRGSNCFEFFLAGTNRDDPDSDDVEGAGMRWNARGWRQGEPSTCEEKPAV